jgi:hypothetical protein
MRYVLRRNLAGQIDYFNVSTSEWVDTLTWCSVYYELLNHLKRMLGDNITIRHSISNHEWEHQPCWDDDRHPTDIHYVIYPL